MPEIPETDRAAGAFSPAESGRDVAWDEFKRRSLKAERWTLKHANDMGPTELAEGRARGILFDDWRE